MTNDDSTTNEVAPTDDGSMTSGADLLQAGICRYSGGKSPSCHGRRYALRHARSFFPQAPIEKFAEPFAGAGAVSLLVAQFFEPRVLWINDLDLTMVAVWTAARDHTTELVARLRTLCPSTEQWYEWKDHLVEINELPSEKNELVEIAAKRIYCQQLGMRGLGIFARAPFKAEDIEDEWTDRTWKKVRDAGRILESIPEVRITNRDFREVIDELDDDYTTYIDPPYIGRDIYFAEWSKENHQKLADRLQEASYDWVLSYGDHQMVDELYGDWAQINKRGVQYARSDGSQEKTSERIIFPPSYSEGIQIEGREFRIDWDEYRRAKRGDLDLERIYTLKEHLKGEELHYAIQCSQTGKVVDGRDRLLAAVAAGLPLDDIPDNYLSVPDHERENILRLQLQSGQKGMDIEEERERLYDLYKSSDRSYRDIAKLTGISKSTVYDRVSAYKDSFRGDDGDDGGSGGDSDDDELRTQYLGVNFDVTKAEEKAFDEIVEEEFGDSKTDTCRAAYLKLVKWHEIPDHLRTMIPEERWVEVVTAALRRHCSAANDVTKPTWRLYGDEKFA